jgi:hypothetical protein
MLRPKDPEWERKFTDDVRAFLCQPSTDTKVALNFPSVFLLHSDESLAYEEALRIGGKWTVDESPLLRDYLHLFAHIIPSEQVEPHLDRLIDDATKDKLLENPDRAQSDLEALAIYCPHPASYLALLKFYRLRNAPSMTILRTAVRFWEVSHRPDHPVLQAVVREYYRPDRGSFDETIPSVGKFALAVWESTPHRDPEVGFLIADHAMRFKRKEVVLNVIQQILDGAHARPEIVVPCINRLVSIGEYTMAASIIQKWTTILTENSDFQVAWASLVVATEDPTVARGHFESQAFRPASVLAKAPQVYVRLLKLAGRKDELEAALRNAFDRALASKNIGELRSAGVLFAEFGQSDIFRRRIIESLPEDEARDIISWFQRPGSRLRRRASSSDEGALF